MAPPIDAISDWTNDQDSESNQKRSDIICKIINTERLDHLETILQSGWDVNEPLRMRYHFQYESIELLSLVVTSRMNEALRLKVIQLLLEHGANPNIAHRLNIGGWEGAKWVERTSLHEAASLALPDVAKLLLDAGAKCATSDESQNPLVLALLNWDCSPDLLKLLLLHGADVNYTFAEVPSLIHRLTYYCTEVHDRFVKHHLFLQQHLDLFFLNGGNIHVAVHMEDDDPRTALEYAVRTCGNSNSVRWLIRHGAELPKFPMRYEYFNLDTAWGHFPEVPLILLQAGMRVSPPAEKQPRKMETEISGMLERMKLATQGSRKVQQKTTFSEYCTQQMVDLQEFSDESLNVYPAETCASCTGDQNNLDQSHRVREFLSHLQSLQWHCRQCVRENLVSLQPSVVKKLQIPSKLKRYILCHEI